MTTEHEYRWTGDYSVIIDGHSTPDGTGVLAEPGKHFKTMKALDQKHVPLAVPVVHKAKTDESKAESDATPPKETA